MAEFRERSAEVESFSVDQENKDVGPSKEMEEADGEELQSQSSFEKETSENQERTNSKELEDENELEEGEKEPPLVNEHVEENEQQQDNQPLENNERQGETLIQEQNVKVANQREEVKDGDLLEESNEKQVKEIGEQEESNNQELNDEEFLEDNLGNKGKEENLGERTSGDLPEYDSDIFDENGNLRPMGGEEYASLTPEQREKFEQHYNSLSKEEQYNLDKQWAKKDLDNYNKNVQQDSNEKNEKIERDLNDVVDGRYHYNDIDDSQVTEYVAKGIASTVMSLNKEMDPVTKSNISNQVGEFAKAYGPQIMKKTTQTAYAQYGVKNPTLIVHEDKFGNKSYDFGDTTYDYGNGQKVSETKGSNEVADNVESKYASTYKERLQQTPINNGHWDGERGESKFYSDNKEANSYLNQAKIDGIEYKDCIPDFSEVSKGDVKIDSMSEDRNKNFKQADQRLAEEKGCSPREVSAWREQNGYTWHECNDKQTCQKIPGCVNKAFGHLGGVSECKKSMENSEFDE